MNSRPVWALRLFLAIAALTPLPARAQITTDSAAVLLATPDSVGRSPISPRGAMLRSFAIPGWGQAAVGSNFRGGVWFSVEATNLYMLFRTITRLNQIRDIEARAVITVTDSLQGEIDRFIERESQLRRKVLASSGGPPPLLGEGALQAAVDAHPTIVTARKLIGARRQQRQDWITYTLFFTLLSGVDAYVNAHLKDFPTSIASEVRRDGSLGLSVRFPLPGWAGGTVPASATTPAGRFHRP